MKLAIETPITSHQKTQVNWSRAIGFQKPPAVEAHEMVEVKECYNQYIHQSFSVLGLYRLALD